MGKKRKRTHLKTRISRQSIKPRILDMKPEDLARYVRQAEQQVLPIIKELEASAGAAIFIIALCTQAIVTGDSQMTLESITALPERILAIWQEGFYHPGAHYPFTLEETLQDLKEDSETTVDYSEYFQPFISSNTHIPAGMGRVSGGIVQHPKTLLWQIWIIMEGPCAFLGAYRDPAEAQRGLERVINIARYGDVSAKKYGDAATGAQHVYDELISQGDGQPEQLPYDVMAYLLENIHLYTIEL